MSSPFYYPGAALPTAALFPYKMRLPSQNRDRWSSCTGPRQYQFNVGNPCCSALGVACRGEKADFNAPGAADYYNPSGVAYGDLEYSSSAGPCYPVRTCLDPTALTYDPYGTQHSQCRCLYKAPRACVPQEKRYFRSDLVCPTNERGETAIQAMYNTARGSKERFGAALNMQNAFEISA